MVRDITLTTGVAVVASIIAAAPVSAEVYQAQGFARNMWSTVSFLDQSSRLAMKRSRSKRIRDFARGEAAEQTAAANAFAAWMDSMGGDSGSAARAQRPAPAGSVISIPFRTAATVSQGMADAIDGVQTGRSVAIDPGPKPTALKAITVRSFGANLDRLAALSGRPFDDLYRTSQTDALLQLSTLYASYIQHGGDPGLRALAVRELPKINGRLAAIKSLR